MNNETAKKGFKTFLLTLSVSLIVFSVIYYALTNFVPQKDQEPLSLAVTPTPVMAQAQVAVQNTNNNDTSVAPSPASNSTFQQLASTKIDVPARTVLAGSTVQPTQSTTSVPDTGVISITTGLFVSLFTFVVGMIILSRNPRKMALNSFEKKILKKL